MINTVRYTIHIAQRRQSLNRDTATLLVLLGRYHANPNPNPQYDSVSGR